MLSQKQLVDVCLLYGGISGGVSGEVDGQCRFLEEDSFSYDWYCVKHRAKVKQKRNETLAIFFAECKTKGIDPCKQGVPLGDNCSGYPILKHLQQGYDVD